MKLEREQVEEELTAAWRREAIVAAHRICGNRLSYIATDHHEHWLPLLRSLEGGQQVFEPVGARWPTDPWAEAVREAVDLARSYFSQEGNTMVLRRLPRGESIALTRSWSRLGDELDTFVIPSQSRGGVVYRVNGRCDCPDWLHNGVPGGWCKHRIARALAKRAKQLLEDENGAGSAADTPAPSAGPDRTNSQDQDTTEQLARQVELLILYEADGADALARIHSDGELLEFKADGELTEAPCTDLCQLYRWLRGQGYEPDMTQFRWLDRNQGHRRRRQVYVLHGDRSPLD